jgi:hypothetical protein
MVKKPKPRGKEETPASVKEETVAIGKEETITSDKDEGKGIDFFYILTGAGALFIVILFFFLIFRYVLRMI